MSEIAVPEMETPTKVFKVFRFCRMIPEPELTCEHLHVKHEMLVTCRLRFVH